MSMIVGSFLFFFFMFLVVGALSSLKNKSSSEDYLMVKRSLSPWLVGLSASASSNSGYMFIGLIGYAYMFGVHAIILPVGTLVGDFLASCFIHKKLCQTSHRKQFLSFPEAIANWSGENFKWVRIVAALFVVIFLGAYASAQFIASSKTLQVLFGWNYATGAIMAAGAVLIYCWAGGLRASVWTDAAQSIVMFVSMFILCITALINLGGWESFWSQASQVNEHFTSWTLPAEALGSHTSWGLPLFIIAFIVSGIYNAGQPHVMVRYMALRDPEEFNESRVWYYGWGFLFVPLAIGVGMMARIYLPDLMHTDPELAMPRLAQTLLPDILIGLMLAGVFAASMSTADSQILSCTAAINNDLIYKGEKHKEFSNTFNKIATFVVTLLVLGISLSGSKNVFQVVWMAWTNLGLAFVPIFLLYIFNKKMTQARALVMMMSSLLFTITYTHIFKWDKLLYDGLPGFFVPFIVYFLFHVFDKEDGKDEKEGKEA